jgi:hypothetical protein
MCLVISVTSDSLSNAASSMPPICRVQMIKQVPDFVKRRKTGSSQKGEQTVIILGSIWIIRHRTPGESRKETQRGDKLPEHKVSLQVLQRASEGGHSG